MRNLFETHGYLITRMTDQAMLVPFYSSDNQQAKSKSRDYLSIWKAESSELRKNAGKNPENKKGKISVKYFTVRTLLAVS